MKVGALITHVAVDFAEYLKSAKLLDNIHELRYTVTSKNATFFRMKTEGLETFKGFYAKMKEMVMVDEFLRSTLPRYAHKSRKARDNLVNSFQLRDC